MSRRIRVRIARVAAEADGLPSVTAERLRDLVTARVRERLRDMGAQGARFTPSTRARVVGPSLGGGDSRSDRALADALADRVTMVIGPRSSRRGGPQR